MIKILVIFFIGLAVNMMNAQNIQGKWMMVKDGFTYSIPEVHVMEFKNQQISHYEFDSLSFQTNYKIVGEEIVIKNGKYRFITEDRLRLYHSGNSKGTTYEIDFERLKPTKTTFVKSEIEQMVFSFQRLNEKGKIVFNKELMSPVILNRVKKKEGKKMLLEKLDKSWVISFYYSGKRESIIPIEEITGNYMKLYGFPKEPYTVIANRIK